MSDTPYSIRPVRLSEIESALQLIYETPGFDIGFYNARSLRAQWQSVLAAGDTDKSQGVLGAFFDSAGLKGMVRFLIRQETNTGRIVDLGVHLGHQHTGIGSELLRHALDQLKDQGCLSASAGTQHTNQAARDFCRAHGANEQLPDLRKTGYVQYEWDLSR